MNLEIQYLKRVDKFFAKNSHILSKEKTKNLVVKSIKKIIFKEDINIDVKQLKGDLEQYYRVRSGKIRILFELENNNVKIIAIVSGIDFRGDIYK